MRIVVTIAAVAAGLIALLLQYYVYEVHYIGFGGTRESTADALQMYFKVCSAALVILWVFRPTLIGAAAVSVVCLVGPGLYGEFIASSHVAKSYQSTLSSHELLVSLAPLALVLLTTYLSQMRRKMK